MLPISVLKNEYYKLFHTITLGNKTGLPPPSPKPGHTKILRDNRIKNSLHDVPAIYRHVHPLLFSARMWRLLCNMLNRAAVKECQVPWGEILSQPHNGISSHMTNKNAFAAVLAFPESPLLSK